jgi:hypothetical protein
MMRSDQQRMRNDRPSTCLDKRKIGQISIVVRSIITTIATVAARIRARKSNLKIHRRLFRQATLLTIPTNQPNPVKIASDTH